MATGINVEKFDSFKVELLDYMESFNAILNRLDNCKTIIQNNISGTGKSETVNKLNLIIEQLPTVNVNINTYIAMLNKVVDNFEQQDVELASDIMKNISRLE